MFTSRKDAGGVLAGELIKQGIKADLVLGIVRGGVVVAKEVADLLHLPLEVLVVKKLGAPNNSELAIGALTSDGVTFIDNSLVNSLGVEKSYLFNEVKIQHQAFTVRDKKLRKGYSSISVINRRVLVVDDGAATGATLFAAIKWLKKKHAGTIILALPVAAKHAAVELQNLVDRCVILEEPEDFGAVGQFYQDFREVSDDEVVSLL